MPNRLKRIPESERNDFRQYCRNCTDTQLRNVYHKEKVAGRKIYSNIAKEEMDKRGL